MSEPIITRLTGSMENPSRYRIADDRGSCEFSVWRGLDSGRLDPRIGSYGGSLWPHEWPELFTTTGTPEWPNGTAQSPAGPMLTDAGMKLVERADQ